MYSYLQRDEVAAYTFCMHAPTFLHERALARDGHVVIGVDEVGCGCLAGPVIAAAVHLPITTRMPLIRDSKLLSAGQRESIFAEFLVRGVQWTIGLATVAEIEELNIRRASYLAMRRAIESFKGATFALIDAWHIPELSIAQRGIIKGDRIVKSIAAASIVAKVVRDRLMREYDQDFPGFGLGIHKGYATAFHRRAILKHGPTPLHRKTFLKKLLNGAVELPL